MSEDTIDKPIEEEQPTEPVETVLISQPRVSLIQCMGFASQYDLGDVEKHYFSREGPYVQGTTGLCGACRAMYDKDRAIRKQKLQ